MFTFMIEDNNFKVRFERCNSENPGLPAGMYVSKPITKVFLSNAAGVIIASAVAICHPNDLKVINKLTGKKRAFTTLLKTLDWSKESRSIAWNAFFNHTGKKS